MRDYIVGPIKGAYRLGMVRGTMLGGLLGIFGSILGVLGMSWLMGARFVCEVVPL